MPPVKLGKIVDVVMRCQQEANTAAAPHTQNVFEAMQRSSTSEEFHLSARQFAQQHGIDTTRMLGSSNKETITEQVKGLLDGGPPQLRLPHRPHPPRDSPRPTWLASRGHPPPGPRRRTSETAATGGLIRRRCTQVASGPPTSLRRTQPAGSGRVSRPVRSTRSETRTDIRAPGQTGLPATSSPLPMTGLSNGLPTNAFNPSAMGSVPQPNGLMQGLNPGLGQGAPDAWRTQQHAAGDKPGTASSASSGDVGSPGIDHAVGRRTLPLSTHPRRRPPRRPQAPPPP